MFYIWVLNGIDETVCDVELWKAFKKLPFCFISIFGALNLPEIRQLKSGNEESDVEMHQHIIPFIVISSLQVRSILWLKTYSNWECILRYVYDESNLNLVSNFFIFSIDKDILSNNQRA